MIPNAHPSEIIDGKLKLGTKYNTPPANAEVAAPKIDKPTNTRAFRAGSVIKPLPKAIRAPIIANNNGMV